MKQAILVTSFGSSHLDTLDKTVVCAVETVRESFPEIPVFRAFTSPTIRRKLAQQGCVVPGVEEVMEQLLREGFEEITVQPTLLIPGFEFDRLKKTLERYENRCSVRLGHPLMWEESDLEWAADLLRRQFAPDDDTVLLVMGHGTDHAANGLYERLGEKLKACKKACMRLCTVEGTPTFADAVAELQNQPRRKVIAAPLMLVAGDHAKNDMAGDEPDSLKRMLEAAGFSVECRIAGLGEIAQVRQIFCERIRQAQRMKA